MTENLTLRSILPIILALGFIVSCTHASNSHGITGKSEIRGEAADVNSEVMRTADATLLGEIAIQSSGSNRLLDAAQILSAIGLSGTNIGPRLTCGIVEGNSSVAVNQLFLVGKKHR